MHHHRPATARGHANHGWLDTFHSFSFADYYDPNYMGFSALRVINEDRIEAGAGFPTHPHREMEIMTYVLSGAVAHRDSMGNVTEVPAGEFQIMSAGTGITHSEFNPRPNEPLHLYQIWIQPSQPGVTPRYDQRRFTEIAGRQLILSPHGEEGSMTIYQDMRLWRWTLDVDAGEQRYPIAEGRRIWLQVVRGNVEVQGLLLHAGDGLAVWDDAQLTLSAIVPNTECLLFDLP